MSSSENFNPVQLVMNMLGIGQEEETVRFVNRNNSQLERPIKSKAEREQELREHKLQLEILNLSLDALKKIEDARNLNSEERVM